MKTYSRLIKWVLQYFKLVIGEVHLQVSYYNANVGSWEPLIEPVVEVEKVYRPWEVLFKVI